MHVLLFHHPFPLPGGATANDAWTHALAYFAQALLASDPAPRVSVCLPRRRVRSFADALRPYAPTGKTDIHAIDDRRIFDAMARRGMTAGDVDRLFYEHPCAEIEALCRPLLPEGVLALDPAVVLGFGLSNAWLGRVFPGAFIVDSEASSFSRKPFAGSLFFDHCGLFNHSALRQVAAAIGRAEWKPLPRARKLLENVRTSSLQWARVAGSRLFGVKRGGAPRLLIAMQASGYSSFDAIVPFRSQFELLADAMSRVPDWVEVFATEHPTGWRHESRFLTGAEMRELEQAFPNLRFFERTASFHQTSQMLLPYVDGVWTVSSNLAQVARLWRKVVGTPAGSHYSFLADATTVEALCDALQSPSPEKLRSYDGFLAWQLQNYVVPRKLLRRPGWLPRYLEQRLAAHRDNPSVPAQFTRVAATAEALLDAPSVPAHRPPLDRQASVLAEMAREALAASFRTNAERAKQALDGEANQADAAAGKRFFLINETARLNQYAHAGCNAVTATILREMGSRGFRLGAAINTAEDFALAEMDELPDLVLLNGEGSLHGGSDRARSMLQWANTFLRRGARVALINTVWQDNDPDMAGALAGFAAVHCRESRSAEALRSLGVDAAVTPDLCFAATWSRHQSEPAALIAVTDSVRDQATLALYDAASRRGWPFLFMDPRPAAFVHACGGEPIIVDGRLAVSALADPPASGTIGALVTGRFHGAVFAIRQQIPFLAIASNTFKTEGLLHDCGLTGCLFPLERYDGDASRLAADIEAALERLPPDFAGRCALYTDRARQSIAGMFDTICGT